MECPPPTLKSETKKGDNTCYVLTTEQKNGSSFNKKLIYKKTILHKILNFILKEQNLENYFVFSRSKINEVVIYLFRTPLFG